MSKHDAGKLEGEAELVRVGGRTYRVRTRVVIEEVAADDPGGTSEPRACGVGFFEMMLSDADATSIDRSEQAILRTSWPAMRDALSRHLTAISQKKPKVQ